MPAHRREIAIEALRSIRRAALAVERTLLLDQCHPDQLRSAAETIKRDAEVLELPLFSEPR